MAIIGLQSTTTRVSDRRHKSLISKQSFPLKKGIKVKALVPGSIYSDLEREGVLKENIYKEYNDINYRWVSYDNWTYEREFEGKTYTFNQFYIQVLTLSVTDKLLSKQRVELVAHGLDTVSTVSINGHIVGKTDNQFIRYKFDVKKVLKIGKNSITVAFESAVTYGKQKSEEYQRQYGYPVPPGIDQTVNSFKLIIIF